MEGEEKFILGTPSLLSPPSDIWEWSSGVVYLSLAAQGHKVPTLEPVCPFSSGQRQGWKEDGSYRTSPLGFSFGLWS